MSDKKPEGRPSKYKPEYCSKLVEHMAQGLSFESFAAVIKVNRDTLNEWAKVHDEFSVAKKEALDANLLFWEKHGIDGLYSTSEYDRETGNTISKSLNATVWIFNMKNRHKWRDKQPGEEDQININLTLADKMAKARNRAGKK